MSEYPMTLKEFTEYVQEPLSKLPEDLEHVLEPWQIKILDARLKEVIERATFDCF